MQHLLRTEYFSSDKLQLKKGHPAEPEIPRYPFSLFLQDCEQEQLLTLSCAVYE